MSGARLADRRKHNFFQVDNEVVDELIERVPEVRRADALAVYSVLCRHADAGGVAWPGVDYIGRKIGRSRPTVIDAIKELGRIGLLGKEEQFAESGGQKTNQYLLLAVEKSGEGGVNPVDGGGKEDLGGGVNRIDTKNTQGEKDPEKNSRRDAVASFDVEKDTFGFFCALAAALDIPITPEDRERGTAKHLKDLKRIEKPTREELTKVVSKILEARANGYEMSPQKALGKVRGNNVVPIRSGRPEPEGQFVSTAGYRRFDA